jgi:hypothetical protein
MLEAQRLTEPVEAIRVAPHATVGERVVAFLRELPVDGLAYMDAWPFEATQDGIARALGLTRAHVALEAKRLLAKGFIEEMRAHVVNGKTRRKVYRVIPDPPVIHDRGGQLLPITQGTVSTLEVVAFRCPTCSRVARVALKR